MYAINRITKEKIEVDPSNDEDLYYQLDKRLYDFVEDKPVVLGEIYVTRKPTGFRPFYTVFVVEHLEDLRFFYINEYGNIVVKEPQHVEEN